MIPVNLHNLLIVTALVAVPGLALAAFATASRLRPDAVLPLVNRSIV